MPATNQKNVRISKGAYDRVTDLARRTGLSRAKVIEVLSHCTVEELISRLAIRANVDPGYLASELAVDYSPIARHQEP